MISALTSLAYMTLAGAAVIVASFYAMRTLVSVANTLGEVVP